MPFLVCNMKYIEVRNLKKYQHYSDRPIIWIKWYIKSLNDYAFNQLTDSQRWLFIGIIMLATLSCNRVCYDPCWIRNQVCRVDGKGVSKVRAGLLKMAKLKLILIKNDSIEKRREEKSRVENISSNRTTNEMPINAEGRKKLQEFKNKLLYKKQ